MAALAPPSIDPSEPENIVHAVNVDAAGDFLLVCEHASPFIPDRFGGLGVNESVRTSHIGWDPGAYPVASALAEDLDAPLLASRVSRLVYDCNRPPEAATAIPASSEIHRIPGNENLDADEQAERARLYYEPFHARVRRELERLRRRSSSPVLMTIHSFTPEFFGKSRATEIGILHDEDSRFADAMLECLAAATSFRLGRNDPYGPDDGVTHTLVRHALPLGIANVMIEIRNDLIETPSAQIEMARAIGEAARQAHRTLQKRQESAIA